MRSTLALGANLIFRRVKSGERKDERCLQTSQSVAIEDLSQTCSLLKSKHRTEIFGLSVVPYCFPTVGLIDATSARLTETGDITIPPRAEQ